jgi:plasmid maintenance system antidote protein VapI
MNRKLKAKIVEEFGHQWRFAHEIGCHEATVSAVIRGNRSLSADEQQRWAEALKCCPKELFGDE